MDRTPIELKDEIASLRDQIATLEGFRLNMLHANSIAMKDYRKMKTDLDALRAFAQSLIDRSYGHPNNMAMEAVREARKHGLLDGDKPTERLTGKS